MKKSFLFLIIIIAVLLLGGIFFYSQNRSMMDSLLSPTPSVQISSSAETLTDCSPQNLKASLTLNPGAGNVYGSVTLQNTSEAQCQITGNNTITANYNKQATPNITIEVMGQSAQPTISLSPNQTVYSQIHFPNGPQCGSAVNSTPVSFSYALSGDQTVTFMTPDGKTSQTVATCEDVSEMTIIQIWNLATSPITQ